jgi:hypothetical protein
MAVCMTHPRSSFTNRFYIERLTPAARRHICHGGSIGVRLIKYLNMEDERIKTDSPVDLIFPKER